MHVKTLFARLGASAATAVLLAALLVPTAWAHHRDGHGHGPDDDVSIRRASGSSVVTVTGPGISGSTEAVPCTTVPASWASPIGDTKWVSSVANCTDVPVGDFTYSTTFSLGSDLSALTNLRLDGQVLVDDTVTVQLNGHTVFAGGNASSATAFATTERSWFGPGTNTLAFIVHNSGGASALDFVATVTADGADSDDGADDDGDHTGRGDNHGACVSAAAHSAPRGPGHGAAVRAAAHSCGK